MADVKKFVIERDRWLRGATESCLLAGDGENVGKMCCLGFFSVACGLTEHRIRDLQTPASLQAEDQAQLPRWLLGADRRLNSSSCVDLMTANDSRSLTDPDREKAIKETFASHGIEVEFK